MWFIFFLFHLFIKFIFSEKKTFYEFLSQIYCYINRPKDRKCSQALKKNTPMRFLPFLCLLLVHLPNNA